MPVPVVTTTVGADATAADVVRLAAAHYESEYHRLNRLAALTTGRGRKDLEAQARYASAQSVHWKATKIRPSPAAHHGNRGMTEGLPE